MMIIKPDISHYGVPARLAILIVIMLISMIIFSFASLASCVFIFHLPMADLLSGEALLPCVKNAPLLKYLQFANQLGLFIVPALLFAWFTGPALNDFLRTKTKISLIGLIVSGLIIFAGLPLIDKLVHWNALMKLPAFLNGVEQWMKSSEDSAALITDLFLKTGTWQGLAANILIMAVAPAIGEEFIFRGVLLRLLSDWTKKKYLGIIISAAIFSAIHLQFYGFLARFVLGLYLGYLFVKSNSIWVPVFAHFVNNAISVIIAYLFFKGVISIDYGKFGSTDNCFILAGSVLLTTGMLFLFSRLNFFEHSEQNC